ncbi:efflux RND transporter periplasmic adaptor subunit [Pseudoalteromonas luteoviolacea]|uniref:efflux RND transporter periplasmic adaptor subunit n=1 Tax=Pseudoalteromonas luteoviolacea TaxID=43657 RepID=UPI001B3A7510|nr:efflux RND transporter periplasmic adaptor subunit [Pseudoalteromonas luteoviolacea]MBQ4878024.1 efflux RND transporter periplasmic adaptor subunit [Pseudoalteromonas luteoviolacea]MBQ4907122.1 efflux RND transporter periplasmic adaptor subunit [Pseudoalteromonas luteoviolacea]
MDTVIEQPKYNKAKIIFAIVVIILSIALGLLYSNQSISSIPIKDVSRVKIASVNPNITAVGTIKPRKSIKLSSDIGGRVKYYLNKKNSFVEKGEVLLELENYDYILKLTEKIAQISEQISNLKNMRLNLRRELKTSKLSLEDAIFQVSVLERELAQKQQLLRNNLTQESEVQDVQSNLTRWHAKQQVLASYYQSQKDHIKHQLSEINDTVDILNTLLLKLQESEQQLEIRAPISGNLSGFDIEFGQQILPKQEFGSLDLIDDFLIEVELSEYYLSRVHDAMQAEGSIKNRDVALNIIKIFPLVKQGKFRMHLEVPFQQSMNTQVKVGQSIEVSLTGTADTKLPSVPLNATFKENNDMFIYLLKSNQSKAVKTLLKIKEQIGDKVLVDNPNILGQELIILDWNKNYKEELYIE